MGNTTSNTGVGAGPQPTDTTKDTGSGASSGGAGSAGGSTQPGSDNTGGPSKSGSSTPAKTPAPKSTQATPSVSDATKKAGPTTQKTNEPAPGQANEPENVRKDRFGNYDPDKNFPQ